MTKVAINTTVDIITLAKAAAIMENSGFHVRSKSEVLNMALQAFCNYSNDQTKFYSESDALEFLENLRIGICTRNKKLTSQFTHLTHQRNALMMEAQALAPRVIAETESRKRRTKTIRECPLDQPIQFTQKEQSSLQELHRGIMDEINSKKETVE